MPIVRKDCRQRASAGTIENTTQRIETDREKHDERAGRPPIQLPLLADNCKNDQYRDSSANVYNIVLEQLSDIAKINSTG